MPPTAAMLKPTAAPATRNRLPRPVFFGVDRAAGRRGSDGGAPGSVIVFLLVLLVIAVFVFAILGLVFFLVLLDVRARSLRSDGDLG